MTSIDALFEWLLEEIFTKLDRRDRLTCKVVCQRWYNILMESIIFKEDRHIFLKTAQIIAGVAPMCVLMQARKPYQIYTIHDNTDGENNDIFQFFKHVGKYIEKLTYTGYSNCCEIFTTMPSLKSLSFRYASLDEANFIFSTFKHKKINIYFNHLKQLQIHQINSLNSVLSSINNIKEFIPNDCSIILYHARLDNDIRIEVLCKVMEVAKIVYLSIDAFYIPSTEINKLLEANFANCDELQLKCTSNQHPYSLLEVIQRKNPKLKNIKLICESLPSVAINFPAITYLEITYFGDCSALKLLEQLPNLKVLKIENYEDLCGFSHEAICMPNLKSFTINFSNKCFTCLRALAESFKNIEEFTLRTKKYLTWNDFRKLTHNWSINLRSLSIKQIFNLKMKEIEMIPKIFPNLKKLELTIPNILPLSKITRAVVPAMKKLTHFSFTYDLFYDPDENRTAEFNNVFDYLESIGLPVVEERGETLFYLENADSLELIIDRTKMTTKVLHWEYY